MDEDKAKAEKVAAAKKKVAISYLTIYVTFSSATC